MTDKNPSAPAAVEPRQDSVITIPSGQGAMAEQLARHGRLADGPVSQNRALQTRAASNTRKC